MLLLSKSALMLLSAATYARAVTLFMAGDSTMAEDDWKPQIIRCGPFVGKYIDINVINRTIAGRSVRSYTEEGRFNKLINEIGKDDIAAIEFGHNDAAKPDSPRGPCPGGDVNKTCNVNGTIVYTFKKYIEDAVKALQAKSAKVIVSSQTPSDPYDVGFGEPIFVEYAAKGC